MQSKPALPSESTPKSLTRDIAKSILAKDVVRASLVLLILLTAAFFPCILGDRTFLESARDTTSILQKGSWAGRGAAVKYHKTLDPGASGWATEPWFQLIRHQYIKEGVVPLWNPYQGYGMPLAANMQSQPFSPFTLLLLPRLTPKTFNFYVLLRLFVGGLSTFLFLRFFTSFLPSLAAGVSCMLTGYYVLFINMPSLSVEVLLPTCFWASERLLRKRTFSAAFLFAIVVAAEIFGGMPESSFLALAFTACYLALRIFFDQSSRSTFLRSAFLAAFGFALSAALVAFLSLPFLEYMRLSWNSHESAVNGGVIVGMISDTFNYSVISYLVPMILGPLYTHPETVNPEGYWGVAAFFFALLSLFTYRRSERDSRPSLSFLTYFFGSFTALLLCKRFGVEPARHIGSLPFFKLILFPKYDEVLLGFCISVLCGLGLERLARNEITARSASLLLVFLFIPFTVFLIVKRAILIKRIDDIQVPVGYIEFSIGLSIAIFILLGLILWLYQRDTSASKSNCASMTAFVALIAFELSANYVIPNYLLFSRPPRTEDSPYKGAPYVKVLQDKAGNDRIFGRDLLLTPSWASAFHVQDIRALDAMYYQKYFKFLYTFFPAHASFAPDLQDRFFGQGAYEFTNPLERRLLQLSSVRYICTDRPFAYRDPILDEIWQQNQGHLDPVHAKQIDRRDVILDNTSRPVLWEHPPYNRLPYKLEVPDGNGIMHLSYGLHPDAYNKDVGDGIGFTVEVRSGSGHITKVLYAYIDPKHNLQQRHWMDASLDLSAFKKQTIELLFSTDPGSKNDTSYDWAMWSNFHFDQNFPSQVQTFMPLYAGEANVYQYDNILPRAALFYHADLVHGEAKILQRLQDPSFDVFASAVINADDLTRDDWTAFRKLNSNPAERADSAQITSYRSQAVSIKAAVHSPALLMLNDSDYPGWKVEVDGKPGRWITTDYLFRGVLLSPGNHAIRFLYRPLSFATGWFITLVGLFSMITVGLLQWYFNSRKLQAKRSSNLASRTGYAG